MTEDETEIALNNYLTQYLLRYFRNAIAIPTSMPDVSEEDDLDLLRLHWAISEPVRELSTYLSEHRHEVQAILETRRQEDDARVRGRFDARATAIRQLVTGHPTLTVSHEAVRSFNSGPNHVLTWVLEQAWRLTTRFQGMLPNGASYFEKVEASAAELETIRRFDVIHQAAKQINLSRRPGAAALKEASRSRRQIYVLASTAYNALLEIEAGDEDALKTLLNDTLLGPLHTWQRFELVVGLGVARSLSAGLARPVKLGFLAGGREPIARVGHFDVYWQLQTKAYEKPMPEPSEAVIGRILKEYGLSEGTDRPDLVVLDRTTEKAMAIVEVKYFTSAESDGADALRAAISQLVRYARGYSPFAEIGDLLEHSVAAVIRYQTRRVSTPGRHGVPHVIDFEGIANETLIPWAQNLISNVGGKLDDLNEAV